MGHTLQNTEGSLGKIENWESTYKLILQITKKRQENEKTNVRPNLRLFKSKCDEICVKLKFLEGNWWKSQCAKCHWKSLKHDQQLAKQLQERPRQRLISGSYYIPQCGKIDARRWQATTLFLWLREINAQILEASGCVVDYLIL